MMRTAKNILKTINNSQEATAEEGAGSCTIHLNGTFDI